MGQLSNPHIDNRTRLLNISRQYGHAQTSRSTIQLAVTFGIWLVSYACGAAVIEHSLFLGFLTALVAAAFVVRLFMIQHDCGHRSFLTTPRANDLLGFWLGVITMTPYRCWRRFHAQHHSHSGNLDQRGFGDIHTLTKREYESLSPIQQFRYRLYRHPLVMLLVGPPLLFIIRQRTTYKVPREWRSERRSVHLTNLGIVGMASLLCLLPNPLLICVFHLTMMSFAAVAGVWLFYMQHQFPDTYWERDSKWKAWRASMQGASYYRLPAALRWLTANIGVHHIHHLDARIPSYRLYECFTRHPEFANPVTLGFRESLGCIRLRLWDEDLQRMVPLPPVLNFIGRNEC